MKLALSAGGEIDLASTDDIQGLLDGQVQKLKSVVKYGRSLDTTLANAAFAVPGAQLLNAGASPGFVRSIRRISVTANDATPATVKCSLYLNDPGTPGNYIATIPTGLPNYLLMSDDSLILNPDDQLYLVATGGTSVATYTIGTAYKEITVGDSF